MIANRDNEQSRMWNGPSGHAWVDAQDLLDRILQPFEDRLLEAVAALSPARVLDIGCGTGSTTLAIARQLGTGGRCTGVDISEPMLALARARAEREGSSARFIRADAEQYPFEPGSADLIVSRFGVMFFDDPVRAFANLRQAAAGNAALRCITWRSAPENPFMTVAERAAAPRLPNLPARRPDAPGQFAFGSREKVTAILESSGWTGIDIRPLDVVCSFPETELVRYFTRLGPVGMALQEADDGTRAHVIATIRPAFDPFVKGGDVRFTAACWMMMAATPPKS
jgi:SAM-dependent methyltransferase